MTSESVFFFHCKDLGRRSEKAAHIITEPPSLKEAFVLVMWVFFVFQPLREKNCVAALIWLGQEPQLDSSSHWTGKKKQFLCGVYVPFILISLFSSSFDVALFFFSSFHSLSYSFGKNSSWIVFLEEETNVRMPKLVQVLAKFDKNKVSIFPLNLPFLFIYLFWIHQRDYSFLFAAPA